MTPVSPEEAEADLVEGVVVVVGVALAEDSDIYGLRLRRPAYFLNSSTSKHSGRRCSDDTMADNRGSE